MACRHRWAATSEGWKHCIRCNESRTTDGDDQAAIVAQWNRKLTEDGLTALQRPKQVFKSKRRQWSDQQSRRRGSGSSK